MGRKPLTAHQSPNQHPRQCFAQSHGLHTISGPATSNHAACPMWNFVNQGRGRKTGCISWRLFFHDKVSGISRLLLRRVRLTVGRLILDNECYAERVTYWLKKWNGIEVERPSFSGQSRGPHDSELCEGCKVGHCPNSNEDLALALAR